MYLPQNGKEMFLTLWCKTFKSSGVSSAQFDKGTLSGRSLTGGFSPRAIALKQLDRKKTAGVCISAKYVNKKCDQNLAIYFQVY